MLRDAPGRYRGVFQGDTVAYTVRAEGGALSLAAASWTAPRALHPAAGAGARFFVLESEREYTFERDASGRVARVRVSGGGAPEFVAERIE